MTEEVLELTDSLNSEENLDSIQEEKPEVESELEKAKAIAKNQRIRAEKAEAELKALKKPQPAEKETPKNDPAHDGLSLKDIRALQDIHDDDVEEVIEYAKFKGISIAEAKKNPVIQNTLKTRSEERASAQASNTAKDKRSIKTASDEDLLNDFASGKAPETEEGIERLVQAQLAKKRAIAKGN